MYIPTTPAPVATDLPLIPTHVLPTGRPPSRIKVRWLTATLCGLLGGWMGLVLGAGAQAPEFSWAIKGGGSFDDTGRGLAVDGAGNVAVVGTFVGPAQIGAFRLGSVQGTPSPFLFVCDPDGVVTLARTGGQYGAATATAVDRAGNIFVTGTDFNSSVLFLEEYTRNGGLRWTKGSAGGGQYPLTFGLAAGPDGGAYLAGTFWGQGIAFSIGGSTVTSAGGYDAFLGRFDGTGNAVWLGHAGGSSSDFAYSVAVDPQGNVITVGGFCAPAAFGSLSLTGNGCAGFATKTDPRGNFLWAVPIPGSNVGSDQRRALMGVACDAFGNSLVAVGSLGPEAGTILKLDSSGQLLWTTSLGGTPSSVATDALGNAYVAGSFSGSVSLGGTSLTSAGGLDIFVWKLDPAGKSIWVKQAGFVFDDICNGVGVDPAGNVLIAGTFHDTTRFGTKTLTGGGDDVFVAKLGNNAVPLTPGITAQPLSLSVAPGATATFGVAASGAAPLRFQWRFNGTNLAGATSALLTLNNVLLANVGSYDVAVSNSAGFVISAPATLTVVPGTPSFGDAFAARGILVGFTNIVTGNNTLFSTEPGEPDHAERKGTHSAWLTWTAPDNGSCVLDTLGSSFDTVLAVYTGPSVSSLVTVAANDDASPGLLQSRVAFSAVAGVAYQIAVDGYSALDAGNISFHLSFSNAAPFVAVQPQSRTAVAGSNATFSVTALGLPPLTYQWRRNDADIPGATEATLLLTRVGAADEGAYSVVIANGFGSVTSLVATLTVLRPPSITALALDQTVIAGDTATLQVAATGNAPLGYQWRFNGTNLPGALLSTLTLGGTQPSQAGPYTVVVSNPVGSVTSAVVNLTVHYSLTLATNGSGAITRAPARASDPPGSVVTVTATAAPGAFFVGWSGDASGTDNPLTLVRTGNQRVVANFAATSLTLDTDGSGGIARTPDRAFYSVGEQVTLTAVPGRWHAFSRWGDGVATTSRAITVGPTNHYTAFFTPTQALETLTFGGVTRRAPVGMPAVFVDGVFMVGDAVTNLDSARVEVRSSFANALILYTLDGTVPGLSSSLYEQRLIVRQDSSLRAIAFRSDFAQAIESDPLALHLVRSHSLDVSVAGGGAVTRTPDGGRYLAGSAVTLRAEPEAGWSFLQWLGDATGTNPIAAVTLGRDKCLQAVFGTRVGTAVIGDGTVVSGTASGLLSFGEIARVTAVPAPGSYFALWGGAASGTNNPLFFSATNAQPIVTAVFQPLPPGQVSLAIVGEGFGTVTNRPRGNRFAVNTPVTLTAGPGPGQQFVGWAGDAGGAQNPLAVTLSASKVITARFTRRPTLALGPCAAPALEEAFQFLISGEPGARFLVEKTEDGQGWSALATVTNLFGIIQVSDPGATTRQLRLYRAADLP